MAQALLGDYPAAGLQPAAALAQRGGVSAPTVIRLAAKLGFAGYADLQARLRAELSVRTAGPVQRYSGSEPPEATSPLLRRVEHSIGAAVTDSLRALDNVDFDTAIDLITDPQRRVLLTGGRVSSVLALYLARCLISLRPAVHFIETGHAARAASLLDIDPNTVLVAFDYRRYDDEVVEFGRGANSAGASIILFTDTYLSPLAAAADVLLPSSVDALSPFITLTPALALIESILVGAVERLGDPARRRLVRLDALDTDLATSE